MTRLSTIGIAIGAIMTAALVSSLAFGGPLDPPAGAISATDATHINQQGTSFPYVIDEPGVYRLTSDLQLAGNSVAIEIGADDVTIDLNGFTIRGDNTGIGVRPVVPVGPDGTVVEYTNTRVINGTFADLEAGVANNNSGLGGRLGLLVHARFDNLTARDCTAAGILAGDDALVSDCRFHGNLNGLVIGDRSTVEDCQFNDNTAHLFVNQRAVIRDNTFYEGTTGISSGSGSSTAHITITDNVFLGVTGGAVDIGGAQRNFIYNNIADDCGPTPLSAPTSDIPISTGAAGAGPRDNIAP
ncbi:MAG: hypothetical protein Tsb0013_12660 [Phycisphaerales bacterium]